MTSNAQSATHLFPDRTSSLSDSCGLTSGLACDCQSPGRSSLPPEPARPSRTELEDGVVVPLACFVEAADRLRAGDGVQRSGPHGALQQLHLLLENGRDAG